MWRGSTGCTAWMKFIPPCLQHWFAKASPAHANAMMRRSLAGRRMMRNTTGRVNCSSPHLTPSKVRRSRATWRRTTWRLANRSLIEAPNSQRWAGLQSITCFYFFKILEFRQCRKSFVVGQDHVVFVSGHAHKTSSDLLIQTLKTELEFCRQLARRVHKTRRQSTQKCPKMSQILTAWCKEKLWQDDICGMRDSALLKMKRRQVACTQGLLCCGAGGYSAILNGASLCIFNARAQNNVWNSQCINDRPCFHGANWNLLNHWRMCSAKWIPVVPHTAVAEVSKIGNL